MGTGFEVAPGEVATAARRAHQAAATVRTVDLAGALAGVGLSGGTSVAAADRLSSTWGRAVPKWAAATEAYAGNLDQAAAGYRDTDQNATGKIAAAGR
ncbi:hypothetical protein [Amycolatopsis rubida]|uniref:Excreted virulence factor EspC, type VII ESX diderm n=1 Tax=Amycolatopsis rubida TaxID=112413 RepID=A0A1I5NRE1_9PSEU|nr:hypothetical protein [Amycolatopsis rubida]SFP24333.1 hypothetical protein SAMN05421854_104498 [Amycolatopsis rubida]